MQINRIIKRSVKISNSTFDFKSIQNRKKNDIEYMKNINNLPIEIRNKVIKSVIDFPPNYTECIYYSQYIASSVPNVKVEMGLFIKDDLHQNIDFDFSKYNANSWVEFEIEGFKTTSYVDENKEIWGMHCWNSYNGIHFDCLKDFLYKTYNKRIWIDYKQLKSVDFEFPNYQSMKLMSSVIKSFILKNRS
jgi:hypothetical protein